MNSTFYLYGDFGFGYNQYPYDGAEIVFRRVASLTSVKQQMFVRRDGDTLYYGLMRRLDEGAGQYFGLCLLTNGVMMRDLKAMNRVLQEVVENIAIADRLLSVDERGRLVGNVRHLIDDRNELERVSQVFAQKLKVLDPLWRALPQQKFGIGVEEVRSVSFDTIPLNVERALSSNGLILVQESEPQRPTSSAASVAPRIDNERVERLESALKQEKEAREREKAATEKEKAAKEAALKEVERLKHAKKGNGGCMIWTLLLLVLLAFLGVAGWWGYGEYQRLGSSLDNKKRHYENMDRTNRNLMNDINALQDELETKRKEMERLSERMALQDTIIDALMDQANIRQPLVSTNLFVTREREDGYASATIGRSVRLNRGEELKVHFRYVGIREGTAHVKLRLTTPSNSWWVITLPKVIERNIPVRTGSNTYDFGLWKPEKQGYWETGKYAVELVLDEQVVQKKEFEIY